MFEFDDLLRAYKKAKVDIFYDRNSDDLNDFVKFESNLIHNLKEIQYALNKNEIDYFLNEDRIGTYSVALKDVNINKDQDDKTNKFDRVVVSDFERAKNAETIHLDWRYVGDLSVVFHVISSLWIEFVGKPIDEKLVESCYGCRLNRTTNNAKSSFETRGEFPIHGNFKPYAYDYKRWQSDAIQTAKEAIKKQKLISVFSTDIKSFYHSINPNILRKINPFFREDEMYLNQVLFKMLEAWDERIQNQIRNLEFESPNESTAGIPIGLSASKVIANYVLDSFDRTIIENMSPLFYGRYVDDILLVVENTSQIDSKIKFWNYFKQNVKSLRLSEEDYLYKVNSSNLYKFNNDKTKLFNLTSKSGEVALDSLEKSMNSNSSEWRLMPDAEGDLDSLNEEIVKARRNSDEDVTSFSKFDGVSVERFKFALHLRNFESLVLNLPEINWEKELEGFYDTIIENIIVPQSFGKYIRYFPRLFGLLVFVERDDIYLKLKKRYEECWEIIGDKNIEHNFNYKNGDNLVEKLVEYYDRLIDENIFCSIPPNSDKKLNNFLRFYPLLAKKNDWYGLFLSDFHRLPLKRFFFDEELKDTIINDYHAKYFLYDANEGVNRGYFSRAQEILEELEINAVSAGNLELSTRKMTPMEMSMITGFYTNTKREELFSKFLKLYDYNLSIPTIDNSLEKSDSLVYIDFNSESKQDPSVVLTNFRTNRDSWIAKVREDGIEPDSTRETRLNRLINDILRIKEKVDYVVFPELSLPRHRLLEIANKLRSKGISLIAGLEYEINNPQDFDYQNQGKIKHVRNQLFYAITRDEGNYNSQFCIIQDKTESAYHEEINLYKTGGKILVPQDFNKYLIQHKSHLFSGLICNDLLNIDCRQPLRGKIDTLFVVEWNKDTDMYNHIVSTTSNDLHCFVAQVNNREYGNTKLRGPYRDKYRRDVAVIKGGELDNFILVEIEADKLREFQRNFRSPGQPFKPVPTGFEMSEIRKSIRLKKN